MVEMGEWWTKKKKGNAKDKERGKRKWNKMEMKRKKMTSESDLGNFQNIPLKMDKDAWVLLYFALPSLQTYGWNIQ